MNVVILRGAHGPGFVEKWQALFSRGRMDTRVGAFESPMCQLHAIFFSLT